MFARIGWYILFLVVLAIYFILVAYLQKQQEQLAQSRVGRFLMNQLQILVALIPIVVIPWILAGFFSRWFLLMVLAAFEITSLLTYFSYLLFKTTPQESAMRSSLWFAELLDLPSQPDPEQVRKFPTFHWTKSTVLPLLFLGLLFLGSIAYFVVASYFYFATPVHSDLAVRKMLTLNLTLYLIGMLTAVVINIVQIASPQISDNGRRALFMTQAAYALQIGIILTVYFALMGIGGEQFLPHALTLPAGAKQYVQFLPSVVLSVFYVLCLIIPYFVGLAGRRRAQISYYQLMLEWFRNVIDAVGIPGQHDPDQLKKLRDEFNGETETWVDSEPMVRDLARPVERAGPLSTNVQKLAEAYRALRDQDMRYVRLNWAESFKAKLDEMLEEYNRFVGQPNQAEMYIRLGEAYERFFRDEQHEHGEKLKQVESRKIVAPVLARVVGVLGAVPVVLQYGQKLIAILPINR